MNCRPGISRGRSAGRVLTAAQVKTGPDSEWLEPLAGATTRLTGAGVWLVLEGKANAAVEIKLSPSSDPPDDVITLELDPPAALLGGSGFGLSMDGGISLDRAGSASPPGAGPGTPAAAPSWQGIVVPNARSSCRAARRSSAGTRWTLRSRSDSLRRPASTWC